MICCSMKPIEGLEVERTGRLLVLAWAYAEFGVVDAVAKLGRSLQERPEVQAGHANEHCFCF